MSEHLRNDLPCFKCGHLMSDVDGHRLDEKVENPIKVASRMCLECIEELKEKQWPNG